MGNPQSTADDTAPVDWEGVQDSPDFGRLRHAVRGFVFPMTIAFLVWYFVYVLLANYAHDFMSIRVWGNVTVGLLFGLGQFVSTFAITMIYARWANKRFDAQADELRREIEEDEL